MKTLPTRVVFRPAAEADLNRLLDYLVGETGARMAGDYVRRIHAACMTLEMFPDRGAPRESLGEGVRVLGFERRVSIAYRVLATEVEILGVFYGGRNLDAIFRDER